jgi:transmembrane sensor
MNHNRQEEIRAVWDRYKAGTATSNDMALLESWYLQYEVEDLVELNENDMEYRLNEVRKNLPQARVFKLWTSYAAAASLVFALGLGYYFYQRPAADHLKKEAMIAGIAPGRNKALLKLANGSEISLTDAKDGTIAEQAGTTVTKLKNGELVYKDADQSKASLTLNTITTPKGGRWQLQLPDGTKVWLNAASTLSYPITFAGQTKRTVELNGEAYFEVSKDKTKPFLVHSIRQNVQVLGTHFNINTYDNEPDVKTTLLEGSVQVTTVGTSKQTRILKPGEQSVLAGQQIQLLKVNALAAIDWKNDEFRFKNESLSSILRKVSRWYDVSIVYKKDFTEMPTFSGSVSRFDDVSSVLKMLEEAGDIHFSIKGKTIYVDK